ncbi:MAG TPA: phycobilisome rod-core linker polypeptide CpcG [Cyanobacteria bacterium UBA11149]|nr:phycobilisome rod-core linker polypeptide CpcG [Cyanobacteria bacterium UBA11367]HBE58295.1 phycobilisome rod-core linker polypeptide CpcG [Cyanobacteria bacterium UBA11366]HBK65760.1 phycobilisome rod-core linker polypeptide CpcG [Cyanobacteria bacterium UBA11166]HBR73024.1 phycobilisome rod-core linker polypeptide CpcG [Cyanobacteria bacterium UBA11159]HBS68890.1 phycobilisome rod-core linker polypeptide CpcG [Cyanobacteria bacterium UBA11153]HBW88171.1 phycobilisome rod-core linker polyp
MTIPLLSYSPSSQNHRVAEYEIPGDEQPRIYTTENAPSGLEMGDLIQAAYRQIFNEQQLLKSNRQIALESQLRFGQITVRDFIRGLAMSETFWRRNYAVNNNYRFVQLCVQRILGRNVYSDREKLAWSTVIATKGLSGFIDALLNSEEYLINFGYDTVPYQRRRILPQRAEGELPFARMPRYGADYLAQLEQIGYFQNKPRQEYLWDWQKPPYTKEARLVGSAIAKIGGVLLVMLVISIALSAWGIISL